MHAQAYNDTLRVYQESMAKFGIPKVGMRADVGSAHAARPA